MSASAQLREYCGGLHFANPPYELIRAWSAELSIVAAEFRLSVRVLGDRQHENRVGPCRA